jgi:hypothetical protein
VEQTEEAVKPNYSRKKVILRKRTNGKIVSDVYDEDEIRVKASSMRRIRLLGSGESGVESAGSPTL